MQFFPLLMFKFWVFSLGLGIVLIFAVYLTWRGYPRDRESEDDPFKELEPDFVPQSEHHPVTPLLVFMYIGVGLWIIGYWIVVGIFGPPVI